MGVFDQLIEMMLEMGVFQVIFPWLLVMSVTYGALEKYEYFEDEMVNGAIALSLGFLTSAGMVLFVPQGLFTNFMAVIAFVALGFIGIAVLAAIGGYQFDDSGAEENIIVKLSVPVGLIAIVLVFLYQYDLSAFIPTDTGQVWSDAIMPVLTMIFIIFIVAITTGGGGNGEE